MDRFSEDVNRLAREQARERALEKVKKLLRVARDGAASENEAETAARQAEAIMRKHQIDDAETLLREVDDDVAFSRELARANPDARGGHPFQNVPDWVSFVAVGVGELHGCKVDIVALDWEDGPADLKIRYSGYALDAKVASWTHDMLCAAVHRLSKAYAPLGRRAATAFRTGAGVTLQERLREMKLERDRQEDASRGRTDARSKTALALFDRKKERVAEMFGQTKVEKEEIDLKGVEAQAYCAGQAAGASIGIHAALPGGARPAELGETKLLS